MNGFQTMVMVVAVVVAFITWIGPPDPPVYGGVLDKERLRIACIEGTTYYRGDRVMVVARINNADVPCVDQTKYSDGEFE